MLQRLQRHLSVPLVEVDRAEANYFGMMTSTLTGIRELMAKSTGRITLSSCELYWIWSYVLTANSS